MSGNPLLTRLGLQRPSLVDRATEWADAGFWLALRVAPEVSDTALGAFWDQWSARDLSAITDVVTDAEGAIARGVADDRVQWIRANRRLTEYSQVAMVIPAAAKGAERLCREVRCPLIVLDESIPSGFADPLFATRAEREKSFVRCAKALVSQAAEGRLERVSLWTRTPRVIAACRTAAHRADLEASDVGRTYEFCVPESERKLAERLLVEGETVRVWFSLDRVTVDRAVAR